MVKIPEPVRKKLRIPLGMVYRTLEKIEQLSKGHRIISVGDVCTLALLEAGIVPHLAVFDFRYMRTRLKTQDIKTLKTRYPRPKTYTNPAGTVSESLLCDASSLLEKGGAVFIEGEEDLTALAFILAAGENDLIIYGQPDEGIVVVKIDERVKKKVRGFLE